MPQSFHTSFFGRKKLPETGLFSGFIIRIEYHCRHWGWTFFQVMYSFSAKFLLWYRQTFSFLYKKCSKSYSSRNHHILCCTIANYLTKITDEKCRSKFNVVFSCSCGLPNYTTMFSVVDNEAGHSGNAALIDSVVVSLADIIIIFSTCKRK